MADQALLIERQVRRRALAEIRDRIRKIPSLYHDEGDLKAAHVKQFPMSLGSEEPSLEPHFFETYNEELPFPEEDVILGPMCTGGYLDDHDENSRALQMYLKQYATDLDYWTEKKYPQNLPPFSGYREIGNYKFPDLYEIPDFRRMDIPEFRWNVLSILNANKRDCPHFKAMLINDTVGDDRLLRGELLAITEMMITLLKMKSTRPHIVAPILLFSMMGRRHIRLLEAHFDGRDLVIRKTKRYSFVDEDPETARMLIRYWLGGARGETAMKDETA